MTSLRKSGESVSTTMPLRLKSTSSDVLSRGFAVAIFLAAVVSAVVLRLIFISNNLKTFTGNADEMLNFLQAKAIYNGEWSLFFWTQPYQFPFEAYLMAVIYPWLPWTALGLRFIPLALCGVSVGLTVLAVSYLSSSERFWFLRTWPGVLIALFPSSYLVLRQVGLMTPQHAMSALLASALPLVFAISRRRAANGWNLLGGVLAGMALSNHLLLLSIVSVCALGHCLGSSVKSAARNSVLYVIGFIVGIAPYLYAKFFIEGAYEKVADTLAPSMVASRIRDEVLGVQIPMLFGVNAWIFPDGGERLRTFYHLSTPSILMFVGILLLATAMRVLALPGRVSKDRWFTLSLGDVAVAGTWVALILAGFTAMDIRTRYLLPIAWLFPLVLASAYQDAGRLFRVLLGVCTAAMLVVNVVGSYQLYQIWRQPDFSATHANLANLEPVYAFLEEQNATTCYAGWWLAYRVTFETRERIICSPPYNDRFPRWHQPFYREIVDVATNTPYVAGNYLHRLLRGPHFVPYLLHHRFVADRMPQGPFTFYSNFRHRDVSRSVVVPTTKIEATASSEANANALSDGDVSSVWSTERVQANGDWIELTFDEALPIHALRVLSLDKVYESDPPRVRVSAQSQDGEWRVVKENSVGHPYILKLDPSFPRYFFDGLQLMFGFEPTRAKRIRIEITEANTLRPWQIAEIHVFTADKEPN